MGDIETIIEDVASLLISKNLTLAFAESATAGRACAEFSLACNAGKFLKGGLICYDAGLKSDILLVPQAMLEKYTPESIEVTAAIALGLTKIINANLHVGITGLACKGGSETPEKPVGTMFIYCLYQGEELFAEKIIFDGTHKEILEQTIKHIAKLLIEHLKQLPDQS